MVKEGLSLVDIATAVLLEAREPMNLYDLFKEVIKRKEIKVKDTGSLLTGFYADLTVSAKFVYTGENMWDLKANQKIELWEKDGSFFKEYTEIELPDEYKEDEKPKPAKVRKTKAKVKPKVEEPVVVETPVVEPKVEEAPVVEETPVVEVKPEAKTEAAVDPVKDTTETGSEEFEEELFDDFDEEKYNEYMDTYEDQYDKKK